MKSLLAGLVMGVVVSPAFADDPPKAKAPTRKPVVMTEEGWAVHRSGFVIDGHNDLPWELRRKDSLSFTNIDIAKPQPRLHTDLARLRKGNVGAQFWSAYVPVETTKRGAAVKTTLEQIDVVHRLIARYPNDLELALSTKDIERIQKSGKIASLIGIEGGHSIDDSMAILRVMYQLGVRYMTLTHSENTLWADSCTDTPKVGGLSPFGVQIVQEMNRLGMLVDLSHVSPDCMKAALKATKAPVIFSHSSARAMADHPRNVPDDVLKLVKANRGVVMVNFYSGFVMPEGARAMRKLFEVGRELRKQYADDAKYDEAMRNWLKENDYPNGTVHDVVDHIEHIIKVAGIECVGLGSDYDGITKTPNQLEDVSCYPFITQELLNRGYTKAQVHQVMGGNLMRVFREAERVSAEQRNVKP